MTLFPNRLHALFIFRQCGSDTLQGFSVVAGLGGGAFILRGEYCFFYAFIVYTAAMHTLPNSPLCLFFFSMFSGAGGFFFSSRNLMWEGPTALG